jgi:hypothetical protein
VSTDLCFVYYMRVEASHHTQPAHRTVPASHVQPGDILLTADRSTGRRDDDNCQPAEIIERHSTGSCHLPGIRLVTRTDQRTYSPDAPVDIRTRTRLTGTWRAPHPRQP